MHLPPFEVVYFHSNVQMWGGFTVVWFFYYHVESIIGMKQTAFIDSQKDLKLLCRVTWTNESTQYNKFHGNVQAKALHSKQNIESHDVSGTKNIILLP